MNQSFQVILNHQQFTKYKQLEKESEKNHKTIHELRQQLINQKLKREQIEIIIRNHQSKIKELSKNSLRLAKRLLIQEENHHKTQQAALEREEELLKKLLKINEQLNEKQNRIKMMKSDGEKKKKVCQQGAEMKMRMAALERQLCQASSSRQTALSEIKDYKNRCQLAHQEFIQATKQRNELKSEVERLLNQRSNQVAEIKKKDGQIHELTNQKSMFISLLKQRQKQNEQMKDNNKCLRQQLDEMRKERNDIKQEMHKIEASSRQEIQFMKRYIEQTANELKRIKDSKEQLVQSYLLLTQSIRQMKSQIHQIQSSVQASFIDYENQLKQTKQHFQTHIQNIQKKAYQSNCKLGAIDSVWSHLSGELGIAKGKLRSNNIIEEEIVLKIEFDMLGKELMKVLTEKFEKWNRQ